MGSALLNRPRLETAAKPVFFLPANVLLVIDPNSAGRVLSKSATNVDLFQLRSSIIIVGVEL